MKISLSPLQGYNVMTRLLEYYAYKINLDDIKSLLSCMQFLQDGETADPALWEDWIDAIDNKNTLSEQEAFDGMIRYLEIYYELTSSNDAKTLIDMMSSVKNSHDVNTSLMQKWNSFVEDTVKNKGDSRRYLEITK